MVTKAIERAQTTVEQRNAEIRKNVLKYDEVMNEQRKVIYQRRDQILEGVDLKAAAMEYLAEAVDALIDTHCAAVAEDEWDLDGLAKELKTFWPTRAHRRPARRSAQHRRDVRPRDGRRVRRTTSKREAELGAEVMREVERQVMLRIIDQRWREHLEEMDYLQEGINLRAMGQKDPLTEWQREGFEMFGALMKGIAQDFVRYVMHVQVVRNEAPAPRCRTCSRSSSDDAPTEPASTGSRRRPSAEGDLPPQPQRGAGADRRSSRPSSRTSSKDAAQRPVPVRIGQEVQALPRRCLSSRERRRAMRDFSDDLNDLAPPPRRGGRLPEDRRRPRPAGRARARGRPARPVGRRRARQAGQHRVRQRQGRHRHVRRAGAPSSKTPRCCTSSPARWTTSRRSPRSPRSIASIAHAARPARAAQPVHRRARRGRLHRADQRQGRRRRRPGLERDPAADVRPLGGAARLRLRAQRRASEGAEAGIISAEFTLTGRYAYGLMTSERGTHRLVRISPFDNQGRRQTSFAAVQVWPVIDAPDVEVNEADIRMEVFRASGAGGQHVNKTSSAVRLIHEPTGLVASSQEERSQLQNREKAMNRLKTMIAAKVEEEHQAELDAIAGRQAQVGWGSQIRSYVCSRTRWSRTCAPTSRRATSTPCSTATSTTSWWATSAGAAPNPSPPEPPVCVTATGDLRRCR